MLSTKQKKKTITLKKFNVLPLRLAPNTTGQLCGDRWQSFNCSALDSGDVTETTVKKAARLAV